MARLSTVRYLAVLSSLLLGYSAPGLATCPKRPAVGSRRAAHEKSMMQIDDARNGDAEQVDLHSKNLSNRSRCSTAAFDALMSVADKFSTRTIETE